MTDEFRGYADITESPERFAKYWQEQIRQAIGLRQAWYGDCREVLDILEARKHQAFNVLAANVETRAAARYNSLPIPDVRPTHFDTDGPGKAGAMLIERALSLQLDSFDADDHLGMAVVADEAYGQGQVRVFWEVEEYTEVDTGGPRGKVKRELAGFRYVPHDRYLEGPATTWDETPWVAFKVYLSRDQMMAAGFDPKVVERLGFSYSMGYRKEAADRSGEAWTGVGYECCWQIWERKGRSVIVLSQDYGDAVLMVEIDPTPRLPGFFPCPRPLQTARVPGQQIPVCPYLRYKSHAELLSRTAQRKQALITILRWRGFHAPEVSKAVLRLADAADGELLPLEGAMGVLAGEGKLDNAFWIMPIRELVEVIAGLDEAEERQKQAIYEITGLSDIMRGATKSHETATAQQLKSQFGSMRIQEDQREVQRFARDILRLMAHVVTTHFADETIEKIAGTDDPKVAEQLPQVLDMLRSDDFRYFKIDVETDSTIQGDIGRMQQNITGFLQAITAYAEVAVPMVTQMGLPAGPVIRLIQAVAGHFKLGKQAELALDELFAQAQKLQDPQQQEAKRQEADALRKAGQEAALRQQQAEAAKTEAEVGQTQVEATKTAAEAEGQQIENAMRATMGPVAENFVN